MLSHKKLKQYIFLLLNAGSAFSIVRSSYLEEQNLVVNQTGILHEGRYVPSHIAQTILIISELFPHEHYNESYYSFKSAIANNYPLVEYETIKAAIENVVWIIDHLNHSYPLHEAYQKMINDLIEYAQALEKESSEVIINAEKPKEINRKSGEQYSDLCAKKIKANTICTGTCSVNDTITANKVLLKDVQIMGSLSAPCNHLSCHDGGQMPLPPLPTTTNGVRDVSFVTLASSPSTFLTVVTTPTSLAPGTYRVVFTGYAAPTPGGSQQIVGPWDIGVRLIKGTSTIISPEVHAAGSAVVGGAPPFAPLNNTLITITHLVTLTTADTIGAQVNWTIQPQDLSFLLVSGSLNWVKLA